MDELEKKIIRMKHNLIKVAQKRGLNSNDTIGYSQELDVLIVKYQRLKSKSLKTV